MEVSDSDSDFSDPGTPPTEIETGDLANVEVVMNSLPKKSMEIYEKQYGLFKSWCVSKGASKVTENVLIDYIAEKSKTMKSPTLWSIYSMLKSTLRVKDDIDISQYKKIIEFLKQQGKGYKTMQSKTFSKNDVRNFLLEAPDDIHLLRKVILIFGISGACRRDELTKLKMEDVEDKETLLIVNLPEKRAYKSRVFIITNDKEYGIDYLAIYRKYVSLRPPALSTHRLFVRYHKGVCTNYPVGINTIGKIPKEIAEYLKLPQPSLYTAHCFRRTSSILFVNTGRNMTQLKRHGEWQDSKFDDRYSECSTNTKIDIDEQILNNSPFVLESRNSEEFHIDIPSRSGLIIQGNENCTFNINIINKKD